MTRSGPSKPSDARHGANRLIIARGFLESAKVQISSAQAGTLGNPIAATVVNAAIAYSRKQDDDQAACNATSSLIVSHGVV
ncbi:hypothetical protein ELI02_36140 [Rhizobium leguminosarum]|nr:hypothetical protein ELI21_34730 [Rhizobium leguminosarum]TAV81217.1 hypothetical protein ELI22_34845 [Rhizobium leguminosarum]TAW34049.1 hypothetical protein ELI23_03715 [Rhizobium leguminosarum]TAX42226.1 hypothetical protein ELI02_36140 [Rhizobium leguminosarum]